MSAPTVDRVFFEGGDVLGEGPYWDHATSRLLWTDIMDQEIHSIDGDGRNHECLITPQKVHAVAATQDPRWYLCTAHRHGLAWLDIEDGRLVNFLDPEPGVREHLLNDGRCDSDGRFWFGSLNKHHAPTGSLYCVDGAGALIRHHTGFGSSNGIAFSPDGRFVYLSDTYVGLYRLDLAHGRANSPTLILKHDAGYGLPDGLTIDDEGCVWVAMALAGQVARITPEGKIDRLIKVPATFVTSCTFGGAGCETLYVSSARAGRPAEELAREPDAGAIFAINVGKRGKPEVPFSGLPPQASGRSSDQSSPQATSRP